MFLVWATLRDKIKNKTQRNTHTKLTLFKDYRLSNIIQPNPIIHMTLSDQRGRKILLTIIIRSWYSAVLKVLYVKIGHLLNLYSTRSPQSWSVHSYCKKQEMHSYFPLLFVYPIPSKTTAHHQSHRMNIHRI